MIPASRERASSRRHILFLLPILVLAALSFFANVWNVPLFFGVHFIFGSVGALIGLALFGLGWGVFIAAVAATYTFFLWSHPYAFIALMGEAIFIGLTFRRFRENLVLASAIYWMLIGLPFIWITYQGLMGMDFLASALGAVKQATNGILNALIASLILMLPLPRLIRGHRRPPTTIFHALFHIVIAAVTIPVFIFVILDARGIVERIESNIQARVDIVSTGISLSASKWLQQHFNAVATLAHMAGDLKLGRSSLQMLAVDTRQGWPDIDTIYISDAAGVTQAFDPATNQQGESNLGLNFSDRAYFRAAKDEMAPNISPVFQGRGGLLKPIVTVNAPIVINGKFAGLVSAGMDVSHLGNVLRLSREDFDYRATLLDSEGKVVASTDPGLQAMQTNPLEDPEIAVDYTSEFFRRQPIEGTMAPMARWRESFLGKTLTLSAPGNWRVIVEVPMQPQRDSLYEEAVKSLSLILIFVIVAFLLSIYLASRLTLPLQQLSTETTNLPLRLTSNEKIRWPKSPYAELSSLVHNFKSMENELHLRFQELQRSNRVKDEFLATLSHELRTPLNSIQGYLDLLQLEQLNEDQTEFVTIARRNSGLLLTLIQDLLDASRIEAGKISLEKTHIELPKLIAEAIESVKVAADAKKIRILSHFDEPALTMEGDSARWHQILWNLLTNSLKFTRSGGQIDVRVSVEDAHIKIVVQDSGEGIEAQFLPMVFNRFQQEDGSTTRRHGGLGLGLFLVRQLVEMHGGTVRAESAGKGHGTQMIILIPQSQAMVADSSTKSVASSGGTAGTSGRPTE